MYSQTTQILYHEHEIILQAIDQVRTVLDGEDLTSRTESIEEFLTFFREYGDLYHHHKEEDLLFSVLARENPMLGEGIVEELTEHHEMFREELSAAREALSNNDFEKVKNILGQYLSNLTDHIAVENDELFVSADEILDEGTKESLYFSFLDKDRELGEDKKREFEEKILSGS